MIRSVVKIKEIGNNPSRAVKLGRKDFIMRENLFRGKKPITNLWTFGTGLLYDGINTWVINNPIGIPIAMGEKRSMVIPETVGQYSGKDDDNGEKMFEGDIVKGLLLHSDSVLAVVTFKDGAFGLEWNRGTVKTFSAFASICNVRYEKIGNIFDNPELLKEGETE